MGRFLSKKKEWIGLSPDSINFLGEQKLDNVRIRLIDFNKDAIEEKEIEQISDTFHLIDSESTTWLNIDGLHNEQLMKELSLGFKIDPLIISDVLDTHNRPKIQEYSDCIFISVKMVSYNPDTQILSSENLVLLIKDNVLISFQERVGDTFNPVRERLRKNKKRIRGAGPDYLAFALIDVVLDHYIYVISRIGELIESVDYELIKNPKKQTLDKIYKYKAEIIYLRKIIKPCLELILVWNKNDSDLIEESTFLHLKDLESNINQSNDLLNSYTAMLSDQLSIFHTTMSTNLNEILKVLTIFSVIFIPLTFIAGIYGTNFDYIPELHLKNGYFYMLGLMVATVIGMLAYFKHKKWF